jgi:hypothetical protein
MGDHVMAHFWRTMGVEPGVDVARVRHGRDSGVVYADTHAKSVVFDQTFDLSRGVDEWNPSPNKR